MCSFMACIVAHPTVTACKLFYLLFAVGRPMGVDNLIVSNITSASVALSWMFGFDGNSEITEASVSYTTIANFKDMVSATLVLPAGDNGSVSDSIAISGLEPHTQYSFSVAVSNAVGTGEPVIVEEWTLPLSMYLTC